MIKRILAVFTFSAVMSLSANADEIQETIQEAQQAYKNKHYTESLDRLEQAMNLIKDVQAAKIIDYFPKPLEGWQVADGAKDASTAIPNVQVGMFSSVIRRYTKQPKTGLSINLLGSDKAKAKNAKPKETWVQFTLLQKPNNLLKLGYQGMHALRSNDPNSKTIELDGYEGVLFCDPKRPVCDTFFDFDGNFMLMVNAERADEETLMQYVKAFDAKGLIKAN